MLKIKRALISVWNKVGIVEFSKKLLEFNIEIISTGKTASILRKAGIPVRDVSSFTSFPEILSGRVKTLHPKIFGGILANKKHPLHIEEIKNLEIEPIDMVVVNFYPFADAREDITFDERLEYIDIGGPALLRAAAKNFKNVACISSISQYNPIAEELERNKGFLSDETLKKLACDVFYLTKEYDNCIYGFLAQKDLTSFNFEKIKDLRYGENPHQKASLYKLVNSDILSFNQIQGKEISFNNILDLDTAISLLREFSEPAAVIVKHASICSAAIDKKLSLAYKKAYLTDTLSSFGGIVALNRKVDKDTAKIILDSGFKECIIAPAFAKEALKLFSSKKNLIVLEMDINRIISDFKDIRATSFGYLIQDRDNILYDKNSFKIPTKRKPSKRELEYILFALKVVKYVKSNAIVVAKNNVTLGIGGGQPSRVGSVKIALSRKINYNGSVLASDGFFPKEDSIKLAKKHKISAIIQPGGSIKDEDIIKLCDLYGISMVFTNIRHFRH